jgi:hypothetical protein
MTTKCDCEVCLALVGLPEPETVGQAEEAYESLPRRVRKVLGAMGRVMRQEASDEDVKLVENAAKRCNGAIFRDLTPQ